MNGLGPNNNVDFRQGRFVQWHTQPAPQGNELYKLHLGKQENLLILQVFLITNQDGLITNQDGLFN